MDLDYKPHLVPQKCPVCEAEQESLSYVPISSDEQKTVIHLNCSVCHNSLFALAEQNDMGVLTVGVLTDLSSLEARGMMRASAITGDEVLLFHKKLHQKEHVSVGELLAT